MISTEQAYKLVSYGVSRIDRVNDVLLEADDLRELNDRQLAVIVICYAASLAQLTKLNLHDFLGLSGAAYQNVEVSKKETTPPTETEAGNEIPSSPPQDSAGLQESSSMDPLPLPSEETDG